MKVYTKSSASQKNTALVDIKDLKVGNHTLGQMEEQLHKTLIDITNISNRLLKENKLLINKLLRLEAVNNTKFSNYIVDEQGYILDVKEIDVLSNTSQLEDISVGYYYFDEAGKIKIDEHKKAQMSAII